MKRFSLCLSLAAPLFLLAGSAFAAQDPSAASLFEMTPDGDLAGQWLDFVFGSGLEEARKYHILTVAANALREGLSVYGLSMLTLAGFFLIWQVASMIAETAQTGVPLGRRTNQLWMPMRFLLGLSLLIPLGSGLSFGQHMIVSLASKGSSLASDAWREGILLLDGKALAPIAPQSPDVARVVSTSFEIEVCTSLYHQLFNSLRSDPVVAVAGDMQEMVKLPRQRLVGERWQYTNVFFEGNPLCGEYRFESDTNSTTLKAVAETSRLAAQRLSVQNRSAAEKLVPALLTTDKFPSQSPELLNLLEGFAKDQTQFVESNLAEVVGAQKISTALSPAFGGQGWIMAGALPFEMARRQMMLGAVAGNILPKVKSPLAGHSVLSRDGWVQAAERMIPVHLVQANYFDNYSFFYDRLSVGMKRARLWLNSRQGEQLYPMLPDQQEVRDILTDYADAELAASVFSRLVTDGALVYGVFTRPFLLADGAVNATAPVQVDQTYLLQPLQTIAEMGRRFLSFGEWLTGVTGPVLSQPATLGSAILSLCVAALFWVGGVLLLFVTPLLPLFRFFAAVVSWALSVLIAIVTLPLVALTHFYPAGDGLVGPLARKAYWLWLSLFVRPSLILFAFAGGFVFFLLGVAFLNSLYFEWAGPALLAHTEVMWMFRGGLALAYAVLVYVIANVAFSGISTIPSSVMDWIGGLSVLPETLVMAGGQPSSGHALSLLAQRDDKSANLSYAAAGGASQSQRKSERRSSVATPQAQTAHFPHIPEDKAPARAEAQARAHASVDVVGDGKASTAVAAAAASSSAEDVKAMAMAKHMPLDKDAKPSLTPRNKPTEDFKRKDEGTSEQVKDKPSQEQSSAPLADENNPFKQGDV